MKGTIILLSLFTGFGLLCSLEFCNTLPCDVSFMMNDLSEDNGLPVFVNTTIGFVIFMGLLFGILCLIAKSSIDGKIFPISFNAKFSDSDSPLTRLYDTLEYLKFKNRLFLSLIIVSSFLSISFIILGLYLPAIPMSAMIILGLYGKHIIKSAEKKLLFIKKDMQEFSTFEKRNYDDEEKSERIKNSIENSLVNYYDNYIEIKNALQKRMKIFKIVALSSIGLFFLSIPIGEGILFIFSIKMAIISGLLLRGFSKSLSELEYQNA